MRQFLNWFSVVFSCKVAVLGVLFFSLSQLGFAQSDGRMRQYMFNQLDFNPGYAGSQGMVNVYALARQQWVGYGKGAPQTFFVNFDIPFSYRKISQMSPGKKMQYSHGLGLHLMRDAIGFGSTNGVELSYSGRFHLRALGSLALGLGIRALNDQFDAQWQTVDPADNDPAIPKAKANGVAFDVSFGLYYTARSMYFGVSGQNLLGADLRKSLSSNVSKVGRVNYARQYYMVGGYDLNVSSRWNLEPSFLARTDLQQYLLSLTLNAQYNNLFWFGVSYHVMESVGALAGIKLFDTFRIGYSYDYPTGAISQFTTGSHEIVVGYSFGLAKQTHPQQYKSIRYL